MVMVLPRPGSCRRRQEEEGKRREGVREGIQTYSTGRPPPFFPLFFYPTRSETAALTSQKKPPRTSLAGGGAIGCTLPVAVQAHTPLPPAVASRLTVGCGIGFPPESRSGSGSGSGSR